MTETDVLVIGGSASGLVTAITAKSNYPNADITVIRKEKEVLVPCGIPYIFGSLKDSSQDVIPDSKLHNAGVNLIVDEAVSVDCERKICRAKEKGEIKFNKIVFATGSIPKVPGWLKGAGLDNVFTIPKDKVYLDNIVEKLKHKKNIVVIGGGFIGVEISDELNKVDKDVTLVEVLPHILGAVFDDEPAKKAQETLVSRGVTVKTGSGIKEIIGNKEVEGVMLQNGDRIEAEAVILSMGYSPNTKLAEDCGVSVNDYGQIEVDEFMRTEKPDVFAVGDCAQKKDFTTRRKTATMLASTACAEARIAGINIFKLSFIRNFKGTIAVFSTAIGDFAFGVAGHTYKKASDQNMDVFTAKFQGPDKHPGKLPGMKTQSVELIVANDSGLLLGGSVFGGMSIGELVNTIAFAIENRMTVYDVMATQIGTHPLLTSPPTAYPLTKAAEIAVKRMKNV